MAYAGWSPVAQLFDHLLPRHCLLCGQAAGHGQLCVGCHEDLPRTPACCSMCALPLPPQGDDTEPLRCGRCLLRPPPWDRAVAALAYRFPADRIVCRFKFGRDLCCGALLAQELLAEIRRRGGPLPDAIVPVPLHRSRYFTRTFNQAELLARALGCALKVPVRTRLLLRRRRTRAQSGLDAAARRRNIRGAFEVQRRTRRPALDRHIALVDDVLTTGVTVAECVRTLKRAGAAHVTVWVAARAPAP
jgi:ComF family protein